MASPNIFIRSALDKNGHTSLKADAAEFIERLTPGELSICAFVEWVLDRVDHYSTCVPGSGTTAESADFKTKQEKTFSRMWIYSHHLYSKIKRKDILFFAAQLDLTGFSMPGKPGIIAIEGLNSSVEEFWGRIRRWQWKRIVMKEKEDFEVPDGQTVDDLRKFDAFSEKFNEPSQVKGNEYHGDRGMLYQYLEEKGLAHIFQYFFGVQGRSTEHNTVNT